MLKYFIKPLYCFGVCKQTFFKLGSIGKISKHHFPQLHCYALSTTFPKTMTSQHHVVYVLQNVLYDRFNWKIIESCSSAPLPSQVTQRKTSSKLHSVCFQTDGNSPFLFLPERINPRCRFLCHHRLHYRKFTAAHVQ